MKFFEFSEINHGSILSRVKDPLNLEENKRLMVVMQDLSYYLGHSYDKPDKTYQAIEPINTKKCTFSQVGDIVIGLTVNKAMVIDNESKSALVPSNFAIIRIDHKLVNPYYLIWFINESAEYKKQSEVINQGSSIKSISIKELRDIQCNLPEYSYQEKIGNLYKLILDKEKLEKKQKHYLIKLLKGINDLKGEQYNGKTI